jgi:hypothetical protein
MAKKLTLNEVEKVNILGKGLLLKQKAPSRSPRSTTKGKRPRYNRRKDDDS